MPLPVKNRILSYKRSPIWRTQTDDDLVQDLSENDIVIYNKRVHVVVNDNFLPNETVKQAIDTGKILQYQFGGELADKPSIEKLRNRTVKKYVDLFSELADKLAKKYIIQTKSLDWEDHPKADATMKIFIGNTSFKEKILVKAK